MKHLAFVLLLTLTSFGSGLAQPAAPVSPQTLAPADPQAAFDKLKSLAGNWVGPITVSPAEDHTTNMFGHLTLRVTSRGNALVHEMSPTGFPDHPVTMFYLDGDALIATHYCDAGNRPRFEGKMSADGNTLEFDFVDLSGSDERGHMQHVVFTFIDENHHIEEWTFKTPDGEFTGRFDVRRTNVEDAASAS